MQWIRNQQDFASGLLFSAVGAAFALGAAQHPVGSLQEMGPGYFPCVLGVILAILGLVLVVRSVGGRQQRSGDIGRFEFKPLFFVIAANLAFGVLLAGLPGLGLPPMGLLVAVFALLVIASMAGDRFTWRNSLVLATILTACSYMLFIVVLGMPLRALPAFMA